jgi:hypothetical protein
MIVADRHSTRLGHGSPLALRQKTRIAPDIKKRAPADKNGGIVWTT